jgi:predicted RNA binding protein YcfA (HicA-like mRNA interferase family)
VDVRGSHRTFRNRRRIVSADVGGSHRTFRNGPRIVSDVGAATERLGTGAV